MGSEKSTVERKNYHGGREIRDLLHLNDGTDLGKKTVLIIGELPQWQIQEELRTRGTDVTSVPIDDLSGPSKKFTGRSEELKKSSDYITFAMGLAFYKKKDRAQLLAEAIHAVKFHEDGELSTIALDWNNFEKFAKANRDRRHAELFSIAKRLFNKVGIDRNYGHKQYREVNAAVKRSVKRKELDITRTSLVRQPGKSHWEEVKDVCDLFEGIVDKMTEQIKTQAPKPIALALVHVVFRLPGLRKDIQTYRKKVEDILALPLEERPITEPPLFYAVTVKAKPPKDPFWQRIWEKFAVPIS